MDKTTPKASEFNFGSFLQEACETERPARGRNGMEAVSCGANWSNWRDWVWKEKYIREVINFIYPKVYPYSYFSHSNDFIFIKQAPLRGREVR